MRCSQKYPDSGRTVDGPSNQTNTHYEYEPQPQFMPEDQEAMQEKMFMGPAAYISGVVQYTMSGGKDAPIKRGTVIKLIDCGTIFVFVAAIQKLEIIEPDRSNFTPLWEQLPQSFLKLLDATEPAVVVWTPEEGLRLKVRVHSNRSRCFTLACHTIVPTPQFTHPHPPHPNHSLEAASIAATSTSTGRATAHRWWMSGSRSGWRSCESSMQAAASSAK